jgi:NAD/NADP transhydrogenase beta subunit
MSDIFVEKMVAKRPDAADWAKLAGVYCAAFAVVATVFYIEFFVTMGLELILLPVLAGAVFGSYTLAKFSVRSMRPSIQTAIWMST